MEIGLVRKVDIDHEMQQSYLDYAMSVIVSRALPDARDGLKPVQRRILYAMYDMGIRADSAYKKSARIVGEVLGKYHPHGDMAVYEAMARQAQDFTMRYTLVDGQGNFGSVDGDPPAAMRYTEARLTSFALELLAQLDRNTVDFLANFDGTLTEPDVLPAAIPNLLVNGANGIAVGMATSIPPHNLTEVIDALIFMLHEWERQDDIAIHDLMRFIKGPDFPTGGIILEESGLNELQTAYATGKGRAVVRGRVNMEDMGRGRSRIIISELPYQVNKSSLIERIAELVRDGVLEGIADLRDESDRHGMRIVIEINKATETEHVLRALYQKTPLQTTIGINLLALVDGEPRLLTLKQALRVYIEHRLVVIKRRSEYDLERAKHRAHILEGYRIALKNLDEIIALIKNSSDPDQARERLMKRYALSEIQAQAILEMQLRRLAALERKKIELEYKELEETIKNLETLLKSPRRMREVVEEELLNVKQLYGDRRKTQIVSLKEGESPSLLLTTQSLTPAKPVWVGITENGLIGRTLDDSLPKLAGHEAPRFVLRTNTHHTMYVFNNEGKAAALAVDTLPEVEKFSDGVQLKKVCAFEETDLVSGLFSVPSLDQISGDRYIVTVTRQGMIKKSSIVDLSGPSAQKFVLAKVNTDDSLEWAFLTNGQDEIILFTSQGMAIRFSEQEVRAMGLVAAGVNAIKLGANDAVIGADRVLPDGEIVLVAGNGMGWHMATSEFPVQGRYGQGVIACKLNKGQYIAAVLTGKKNQVGILHFSKLSARLVKVEELPLIKRPRVGTELVAVKPGDEVLVIAPVVDGLTYWNPEAAEKPKRSRKPADQPEFDVIQEVSDLQPKKAVDVKLPSKEKASIERKAGKSPVASKKKTSPQKAAAKKASAKPVKAEAGRNSTKTKSASKEQPPTAKQPRVKKPVGEVAKPVKQAPKTAVLKVSIPSSQPELPLAVKKPESKPHSKKKPTDKPE